MSKFSCLEAITFNPSYSNLVKSNSFFLLNHGTVTLQIKKIHFNIFNFISELSLGGILDVKHGGCSEGICCV